MKRIIMLLHMEESDVTVIEMLMEGAQIRCRVSLATKSVIIDGNNDELAAARRIFGWKETKMVCCTVSLDGNFNFYEEEGKWGTI